MNIFWRILFAHLLTDFTLQTEQLVKWKREKTAGLSVHVLIFFLVGLFLTWNKFSTIWSTRVGIPLYGWVSIFLISGLHFLLDDGRIKVINHVATQADNLYFFLLDQLFHFSAIYLLTPTGKEIEKWAIFGCLFVAVTHFANVFLYYLEKKQTNLQAQEIKVFNAEKNYSLIERLIIASCFLLPGFWWTIFLLIIFVRPGFHKLLNLRSKGEHFSLLLLVVNYVIALSCGILARVVLVF